MLTTQLNYLTSLAKWLSVRLWTMWLWVQSSCSHLNVRFCPCFEQGVYWHSSNYWVWIHSETRTWHDNNIQCNSYFPETTLEQFLWVYTICLFVKPVSKNGENVCQWWFLCNLIWLSSWRLCYWMTANKHSTIKPNWGFLFVCRQM